MALKGTLKDFGIADILQLIGQQQKTGLLHLRSKDREVQIGFREGNIIKAETTTRKRRDLIGTMLVRAQLITDAQLEAALETQRRTLKRLGDVLVSTGAITESRFRQMVYLQMTETLYALFQWKSGKYEFEQIEVEAELDDLAPVRAETVLMEGFRMVDEWPVIRKTITSDELTFKKVKDLPRDEDGNDDLGFDGPDSVTSESKKIGPSERRIYNLIESGRSVRELVDLSCLGEFETCKTLVNLISMGFVQTASKATRSRQKTPGYDRSPRVGDKVRSVLSQLAAVSVALALAGLLASRIEGESVRLSESSGLTFEDPATQRFLSQQQVTRIAAALDVYRSEKGNLPENLDALVESGLLRRDDLRHPWRDTYYYRRTGGADFVLLPPLR